MQYFSQNSYSQIIALEGGHVIVSQERTFHNLPLEAAVKMLSAKPHILRTIDFSSRNSFRGFNWLGDSYYSHPNPVCELTYFRKQEHENKKFLRIYERENITMLAVILNIKPEPQFLNKQVYEISINPLEDIQLGIGLFIPSEKPVQDERELARNLGLSRLYRAK